jgi:hypothetical protein
MEDTWKKVQTLINLNNLESLSIQEKFDKLKSLGITKQEFINYQNSLLWDIPDEELMERKLKYYGSRNSI